MPSAADISVEEQVKRLAALPFPRIVRPTWSNQILILMLGFLLLASCARFYEALSSYPVDYSKLVGAAVWAAFLIVIVVHGQIRPRERSLFKTGTPTTGRVLSTELRRSGTRVRYSYEATSGGTMESEIVLYRRRDLTKGMSVVVFCDPDIPDHSSILGYSHWEITIPNSTAPPNQPQRDS